MFYDCGNFYVTSHTHPVQCAAAIQMFIMTDDECRYLAMCAPRDECAELASFSLASRTHPSSNWNGDRNSSTLVTQYARRTGVLMLSLGK